MAREFGQEVAPRLKEVIRANKRLTLVGSFPSDINAGLTVEKSSDSSDYEAMAPGEVLIVGCNQPTPRRDNINRMMNEVIMQLTDDLSKPDIRLASLRSWSAPRMAHFGMLSYLEQFPGVSVDVKVYQTVICDPKNPYLEHLLKTGGVGIGTSPDKTRSFPVTRRTTAVLYPSVLIAKLAAELKNTYDKDPETFDVARVISGAIITMDEEDLNLLFGAESQERDQQMSVMRLVASRYSRRSRLTAVS